MTAIAQAKPVTYRRWQVQILLTTWLAYAGYYFCRMNFYAVKKDLGQELGFDTSALGHLGTVYLAGYMLGQFSSATFGRLLGPKRLLLVGTGLSVLCNVGLGLADGFWTFAIFLGLNGLAQGTGWPSCIGSLGYWFKRDQRGSVLGVWSTCYLAGPFLATNFAGLMLQLFLDFRAAFFGAAAVLLLIWIAVLIFHPDTPEKVGLEPVRDGQEPEVAPDGNQKLGWSGQVVATILMMGCIYFCIKFVRYLLFSWTPFFLGNNFGLEGPDAAYLSSVFYACGFAGVLFAGFVTDRVFKGKRAFLCLLMLGMMALSLLLMATLGSTRLLFFTISMGLCGFMLYGPDSVLSGVGAIDVGSQRGALVAAGIINGMGSAGPVFQEQLVAWLYQRTKGDLTPILVLLFSVAAAGAVLMFLLWLRSRRGKSNL
ncbi:MAG: MFS transporter [Deltaproteobacteria bacterium]|nr:MFS transporter [Deltaproteobacteria bacterium]